MEWYTELFLKKDVLGGKVGNWAVNIIYTDIQFYFQS